MAHIEGSTVPRRWWPIELAGGSIFVVLVLIIGLFISRQPHRTAVNNAAAAKISPTPDSYNDCIGVITAINDPVITLDFTGTTSTGTQFTKTFTITLTASTDLKRLTLTGGKSVFSPIQRSDLKVGRTVFAAADKNIQPLSEFTAAKLYLY